MKWKLFFFSFVSLDLNAVVLCLVLFVSCVPPPPTDRPTDHGSFVHAFPIATSTIPRRTFYVLVCSYHPSLSNYRPTPDILLLPLCICLPARF